MYEEKTRSLMQTVVSRMRPARTDQWNKTEIIIERKSMGKMRKLMGCSGYKLIGTEYWR